MNMIYPKAIIVLVGAFALAASFGHAQEVLLGNLPWTGSSGDGTVVATTTRVAVIFTTPGVDYTVNSVVLNLTDYYGSPETLSLGFYVDNGSLPGAVVGGLLINPAGTNGIGVDYSFATGSTVTLAANTQYWMVFSVPTGLVVWDWNAGGGTTPTGLATFVDHRWSYDDGSSYGTDNSVSPSFQINATAVPEPATWTLMTGGLAGLVALLHRRKQVG